MRRAVQLAWLRRCEQSYLLAAGRERIARLLDERKQLAIHRLRQLLPELQQQSARPLRVCRQQRRDERASAVVVGQMQRRQLEEARQRSAVLGVRVGGEILELFWGAVWGPFFYPKGS